jgi:hypothetical protein
MKRKMVMKNQLQHVEIEDQLVDNSVDKVDLVYPNQTPKNNRFLHAHHSNVCLRKRKQQ